jgi:hypothetical protein
MICFKDDKAVIEYLVSEKAIYCSWEGEVPSEQFQKVMQLKLHLIRELSVTNWMLDIRYMQSIGYPDQQWLLEKWIPEFLKSSVHKIAIIQSFDVYNAMVVEDFLRYTPINTGCEIQFFADSDASLAWIRDLSESTFLMNTLWA